VDDVELVSTIEHILKLGEDEGEMIAVAAVVPDCTVDDRLESR
jgi:hypothetical protein